MVSHTRDAFGSSAVGGGIRLKFSGDTDFFPLAAPHLCKELDVPPTSFGI
jgi:hypothetical protein